MLKTLFEGEALWFSIPALLGTGIFLIRILMMLIGGDAGDGGDADVGDMELDGQDSADAFEILSIQGISAFLMGFGWVGIGSYLGAGWSPAIAIGLGSVGGFAMVWILGNTLGAVRGLESSGNISIDEAIGKVGEVYARVPAKGQGKGQVRLVLSNRQRIYNAVSEGDEFKTNTQVQVIQVNDDHSLTVGPA